MVVQIAASGYDFGQYLASLKSEAVPRQQRISDYSVDPTSGNTPEQEAAGIYVLAVAVRLLSEADNIVLLSQVGESVTVTVQ